MVYNVWIECKHRHISEGRRKAIALHIYEPDLLGLYSALTSRKTTFSLHINVALTRSLSACVFDSVDGQLETRVYNTKTHGSYNIVHVSHAFAGYPLFNLH
jgi:hypothetical protein